MPDDYDIPRWVSDHEPARPAPDAAPLPPQRPHERAVRAAVRRHREAIRRRRVVVALLGAVLVFLGVRAAGGDSADSAAAPAARTSTAQARTTPLGASSARPATSGATGSASANNAATALAGRGTLHTVPLAAVAKGAPAGSRTVTVGLAVEDGLGVDERALARAVVATLQDQRGWQREDGVEFRFVDAASSKPAITVTFASDVLVDELCKPLDTHGDTSCFNQGRAVINAGRWAFGTVHYEGDVDKYRIYVLNHEVGHGLGHGHLSCPKPSAAAPVMLQQTLFLHGCRANPWPAVA